MTSNRPLRILSSLLTDVRRFDPDLEGLDRDIITIEHRVKDEGISFLTVALPRFALAFDNALAHRRLEHVPGFGRNQGQQIPKFLSGIVSRIFDLRTGHLKENVSLSHIKSVRQILLLFKKFSLSVDNTEALDRAAKRKFFSTDDEMEGFSFPSDRSHLLKTCCKYILPNLDSELEDIDCKHGPGAVVEGHLSNSKWKMVWDHICKYDDLDHLGFQTFGLVDRIPELQKDYVQQHPPRGLAKLISVVKNSTSRRTITIEPGVRQFIQQGLGTKLRREIEKCRILSNSLALTDQSKNSILALEGSLTGELATIDLSSASDRLSIELVSLVFGDREIFLSEILSWRSSEVREGQKPPRLLKKFAGQGNATTFPVQSVCYTMLCIAAIIHSLGIRPSYRNVMRTSRMVRVYGDDIIVPTKHVSQVVEWLEQFGMKVNHDKSFTVGNFRESCGVDAFNGVEVTPYYLKFDPSDPKLESYFIKKAIDGSNHLWMNCYYSLSEAIIEDIRGRINHLPLKHTDDGFVGLANRWNARTYNSWSKDFQRATTKAHTVVSRLRRDPIDGWPALLKSLMTPLLGRPEGHLERVPRKYDVKLITSYF